MIIRSEEIYKKANSIVKNCGTRDAPELVDGTRRVKRYQYEMMGIVYPPHAEKNILIDYGIMEKEE